ncbi:hypothetical protein HMPREF1988_00069 [Porphyromonas gingivalis F0185]|nr:hypothetical protein HMPREF1988_00069 [Porphyromonas gingivalis F0185]PDP63993.1 hypothetical protein CLI80_06845 [Porphyromonas gingivalis]
MFDVRFIRRNIWSCKVYGYFECLFNFIEWHKLGSVVRCDRMQLPSSFEIGKPFYKDLGDGLCLSSSMQSLKDGKVGFSIREHRDGFLGLAPMIKSISNSLLMIDTAESVKKTFSTINISSYT